MGGRLGLGVATALSLLTAGGLYAQGPAPAPQAFTSNAYPGAAYGPPPTGQGGALLVQQFCSTGFWTRRSTDPPSSHHNSTVHRDRRVRRR